MNPEMSAIITASAGLARRPDVEPVFESHDDAPRDIASLQEVELTFAADVNPYFKARLFLAIPRLETLEVEEGYLLSTSLPLNLQLKAGFFRSAFGRNNEQHLHSQDFAVRPWTTGSLGEDGLRPAGAQLSVLLPLPWYTVLWAEGFVLQAREPAATFGIDQFWELSSAWSLMLGLSGATLDPGLEEAHAHAHFDAPPPTPGEMLVDPGRRELLGGDLYLKWRPSNETQTYSWLALTAEWIGTRERGAAWSGIGYAQLVGQVARRWRLGVRGDLAGFPEGDEHLRAAGCDRVGRLHRHRVLARALHLPAPARPAPLGQRQRHLLPAARGHHRRPRRPPFLNEGSQ